MFSSIGVSMDCMVHVLLGHSYIILRFTDAPTNFRTKKKFCHGPYYILATPSCSRYNYIISGSNNILFLTDLLQNISNYIYFYILTLLTDLFFKKINP